MNFGKTAFCAWVLAVVAPFAATGVSSAASGAPEVTLSTVGGERHRGVLKSFARVPGAVVERDDAVVVEVPTAQIVRLAMAPLEEATDPYKPGVRLAGGDRVYGRLVGGGDGLIAVDADGLGVLRIPLPAVRRSTSAEGVSRGHREALDWFDRRTWRDDAILLTNGDVATGFVVDVDRRGVTLDGELGESVVDHRLVVAFELALAEPPVIEGRALRVTMVDGARLTLTEFRLEGDRLVGTTWFGADVDIRLGRICRAEVTGGRWTWLEAIEPLSFEQVSMLSLHWPYRVGKNVLGGPLRVAGVTYEHGLGVHSRSKLIFDLGGRYAEFVTSLGLDDSAGGDAHVAARIVVDGQARYVNDDVAAGMVDGPVRIDVRRARTLELICDFGRRGDLRDRFNWIDAGLVADPN